MTLSLKEKITSLLASFIFILPVYQSVFGGFYTIVFILVSSLLLLISVKKIIWNSFRIKIFYVFIVIIFCSVFISFNSYVTNTNTSIYSQGKINSMSIVIIFYALILPLAFQARLSMFYKFGVFLLILSTVTSCLTLISYDNTLFRANKLDTNPIWLARACGFGMLISLVFLLYYKNSINKTKKKMLYATVIVSLAAVFSTGSKGPLLSIIGAIVIVSIVKKRSIKSKNIIILIFFLLFGFELASLFLDASVIERFSFNSVKDSTSGSTRSDLYFLAIDLAFRYPEMGVGIGNFYDYSHYATYPHNLILEMYSETGLFFGTFFLAYIIYTSIKSIILLKAFNNMALDFSVVLFFYGLLNSMFSGDMTSATILYFSSISIILMSKKDFISLRK